jgi:hypothetical protein
LKRCKKRTLKKIGEEAVDTAPKKIFVIFSPAILSEIIQLVALYNNKNLRCAIIKSKDSLVFLKLRGLSFARLKPLLNIIEEKL